MVYTSNWGIIWYLPPIKGTRNSYWLTLEIILWVPKGFNHFPGSQNHHFLWVGLRTANLYIARVCHSKNGGWLPGFVGFYNKNWGGDMMQSDQFVFCSSNGWLNHQVDNWGDMDVSKNSVIPKSSNLIGFFQTIHFGVPLFLETPIYTIYSRKAPTNKKTNTSSFACLTGLPRGPQCAMGVGTPSGILRVMMAWCWSLHDGPLPFPMDPRIRC